jgi:very-short-patch-repair endonuclease
MMQAVAYGETHVGRGSATSIAMHFPDSGFRVLRVTNDDVIHDVDAVLEEFLQLVRV